MVGFLALVGSVAVMVRMGGQGRILTPARLRKRLKSRLSLVEAEDDDIDLGCGRD